MQVRRLNKRLPLLAGIALALPSLMVIAQPVMSQGQLPTIGSIAPIPLPPVEGDARDPVKLASYPRDFTEPLLDQPDNPVLLPETAQPAMPPHRDGFFQRIAGTTTYLPRLGSDSVGFEDTEIYGVFAVPFPTTNQPLLLEPGTDFWVVDAPGFDLPATLHDDYFEFHWLAKLWDGWGADVMVTPGWHSDYHNANASQAFRVESHAVAAYDWSPKLKLAAGLAYWGRLNTTFVPAGGVIWTPRDDLRFELITPKPRIAYRIGCEPCYQRWLYVAGEFGGGEWAIRQTGGIDNIVNYSDYRIMLGLEHKSMNLSLNGRAEIGYVFGRKLEYESALAPQDLPGTLMARLGASY